MTSPGVARDQIAERLGGFPALETGDCYTIADALSPLVDRLCAEAAAEALQAAADWLSGGADGPAAPEWPDSLPRVDVASMLRDRTVTPSNASTEISRCPSCESPFHGHPCPRDRVTPHRP